MPSRACTRAGSDWARAHIEFCYKQFGALATASTERDEPPHASECAQQQARPQEGRADVVGERRPCCQQPQDGEREANAASHTNDKQRAAAMKRCDLRRQRHHAHLEGGREPKACRGEPLRPFRTSHWTFLRAAPLVRKERMW